MSILTPLSVHGQASPEAFRLARLFVDTFGMQHPARSGKSPKSYAAHLTGLWCGVEYNGASWLYAALQRWLNRPVAQTGLTRPSDLSYRGALTVRHIYDAANEIEADTRIHEWAGAVWSAYAPQHDLVKGWITKATQGHPFARQAVLAA